MHGGAAGVPGKRTLTEQLDVSTGAGPAGGPHAEAAAKGRWTPPSAGVVSSWMTHWASTWTTIAGQAFGDFEDAVRADSNKSSNVGALVAMAGDAIWVVGGLTGNPPAEILGAALSGIGAFIQPGHPPRDDEAALQAIRKGLDRFSSQLNDNADVRSHWEYVLRGSDFKTAGSDANAHAVLRKHTHVPNTDDRGKLRHDIAFALINQYLHLKKAYIEHKTDFTLGGDITADYLKNVSGGVAHQFSTRMGINPLPTDREGHATSNPFHLGVKDTFGVIA